MAKMYNGKVVGIEVFKSEKKNKNWQILMVQGGKAKEGGVYCCRIWHDGEPYKVGDTVRVYDDLFKQSLVDVE